MLKVVQSVAVLQLEFVGATIGEQGCYRRRASMLPSVAKLLFVEIGMSHGGGLAGV
jgi:hypothetical protein